MAGPEIQSAKQTIVCKDNSGYDYEESLFSNYHTSPNPKLPSNMMILPWSHKSKIKPKDVPDRSLSLNPIVL